MTMDLNQIADKFQIKKQFEITEKQRNWMIWTVGITVVSYALIYLTNKWHNSEKYMWMHFVSHKNEVFKEMKDYVDRGIDAAYLGDIEGIKQSRFAINEARIYLLKELERLPMEGPTRKNERAGKHKATWYLDDEGKKWYKDSINRVADTNLNELDKKIDAISKNRKITQR